MNLLGAIIVLGVLVYLWRSESKLKRERAYHLNLLGGNTLESRQPFVGEGTHLGEWKSDGTIYDLWYQPWPNSPGKLWISRLCGKWNDYRILYGDGKIDGLGTSVEHRGLKEAFKRVRKLGLIKTEKEVTKFHCKGAPKNKNAILPLDKMGKAPIPSDATYLGEMDTLVGKFYLWYSRNAIYQPCVWSVQQHPAGWSQHLISDLEKDTAHFRTTTDMWDRAAYEAYHRAYQKGLIKPAEKKKQGPSTEPPEKTATFLGKREYNGTDYEMWYGVNTCDRPYLFTWNNVNKRWNYIRVKKMERTPSYYRTSELGVQRALHSAYRRALRKGLIPATDQPKG